MQDEDETWHKLPVELLHRIIAQLSPADDRATLRAAALSSSIVRDPAQRVLFSNPRIDYTANNYHDESSHDRPITFLETVINSPERLALYIRYYTYFFPLIHRKIRILFDLSCRALKAMVNLKGLYISGLDNQRNSPDLLRGCTFQLMEFGWGSADDDVFMVREFLPAQSKLKHLRLRSEHEGAGLKALMPLSESLESAHKICPNLITLVGERGVLDAFLPGKKVRYLRWERNGNNGDEPPNPVVSPGVAEALGYVEYMTYGTAFYRPPFFLIAKHLKSVRLLKIVGCRNEEYSLLKELPCLEILIIAACGEDDPTGVPNPEGEFAERSVADRAFLYAQKLQYIDIQPFRFAPYFSRFFPASRNMPSQEVSSTEVHAWIDGKVGILVSSE